METNVVNFYNEDEEYGFMSNYYPASIELDGKTWATTEHYFQALKYVTTDPDFAEEVRKAPTPGECKALARNGEHTYRSDWREVKFDVMHKCCKAKFTQHEDLKKMLLETGDAKLVEHTANDSLWGDGGDGSGQNHLGRILMKIRDELKE